MSLRAAVSWTGRGAALVFKHAAMSGHCSPCFAAVACLPLLVSLLASVCSCAHAEHRLGDNVQGKGKHLNCNGMENADLDARTEQCS